MNTIQTMKAEIHFWVRYSSGACGGSMRVEVLNFTGDKAVVAFERGEMQRQPSDILDDDVPGHPRMRNPFPAGCTFQPGEVIVVPAGCLTLLK